MKFSFIDLLLAPLCIVLILLPDLIIVLGIKSICPSFSDSIYLPFVQLFLFVVCFFLFSLAILWCIRKAFPLDNGVYDLSTNNPTGIVWKLQGFLYIFNLGLFINSYLVPVNLRGIIFSILGSRIGKNVMIGGKILEPALVKIGDYTILGEDTLITAHAKEGHKVQLGKIIIGNEVTVGVKAVILPDVEIGNHSIIAAGAVVSKGTRIPKNEIWGGIPAKCIKKINSNSVP